jgi:lipoprotein Spr
MLIKNNKFTIVLFYLLLCNAIIISSCKTSKKATESSKENKESKESTASKNKLQAKYAEQLGVSKNEILNIELYTFVDEWIGTPYKYGGKSKEGIDCSDFTVILCKTVYNKNIDVPASKIYSQCKPIDISEIKEGDLVFFTIDGGDRISHVGVYLQNNKFIHASTKKGVIINDLNEAYYKKYFYKAARIK